MLLLPAKLVALLIIADFTPVAEAVDVTIQSFAVAECIIAQSAEGRLFTSKPSTTGNNALKVTLNVFTVWSFEEFPSVAPLGLLEKQVMVCVPAAAIKEGRLIEVPCPVTREPFQLKV